MVKKENPKALFIVSYYCSSVGAHRYVSIRRVSRGVNHIVILKIPSQSKLLNLRVLPFQLLRPYLRLSLLRNRSNTMALVKPWHFRMPEKPRSRKLAAKSQGGTKTL